MNLKVLRNKLKLDKLPIIQKYFCHKVTLYIYIYVTLGSIIRQECSI
jgi:hypothetical protein